MYLPFQSDFYFFLSVMHIKIFVMIHCYSRNIIDCKLIIIRKGDTASKMQVIPLNWYANDFISLHGDLPWTGTVIVRLCIVLEFMVGLPQILKLGKILIRGY